MALRRESVTVEKDPEKHAAQIGNKDRKFSLVFDESVSVAQRKLPNFGVLLCYLQRSIPPRPKVAELVRKMKKRVKKESEMQKSLKL